MSGTTPLPIVLADPVARALAEDHLRRIVAGYPDATFEEKAEIARQARENDVEATWEELERHAFRN